MARLTTGTLVRVTNHRNLAYGRIAMVMSSEDQQSTVRFADLPKFVESIKDLTVLVGVVETFNNRDLTPIPDIVIANKYVLVTISINILGQPFVHHCLAHGDEEQSRQAIAEFVAQK